MPMLHPFSRNSSLRTGVRFPSIWSVHRDLSAALFVGRERFEVLSVRPEGADAEAQGRVQTSAAAVLASVLIRSSSERNSHTLALTRVLRAAPSAGYIGALLELQLGHPQSVLFVGTCQPAVEMRSR